MGMDTSSSDKALVAFLAHLVGPGSKAFYTDLAIKNNEVAGIDEDNDLSGGALALFQLLTCFKLAIGGYL